MNALCTSPCKSVILETGTDLDEEWQMTNNQSTKVNSTANHCTCETLISRIFIYFIRNISNLIINILPLVLIISTNGINF